MNIMPAFEGDPNCLEEGRLTTFDETWPHKDGSLGGENMAKAGFSFVKKSDIVACFCCSIKIGGWETGDEPWARHIELSPDCIFAKLAKEEGELTVSQFCDIMCARSIAMLDSRYKRLANLQEKHLTQEPATNNANGDTVPMEK